MNPDFKIINLYSGSKGNCTLIRSKNTSILIDAGKSAAALCSALNSVGEDIRNIRAIFVTHEHTDHVSSLAVLSKKHHIPIHATESSASKMIAVAGQGSVLSSCLHIHTPIYTEKVCGDDGEEFAVRSFPTPHDSLSSVGYRVELLSKSDSESNVIHSFGYATDTGCVTDDMINGLGGCESVIIEANHDIDMLLNGPYPHDLKMRIMSDRGHLSNYDCATLAQTLVKKGTKNFLLAHLSEENNTPEAAFWTVRRHISNNDIGIFVASPNRATILAL